MRKTAGENIQARTFTFAVRIVKLCQDLDEHPGVARTLSRQLLRSGTSIGANMEEAQAGESKPDFAHNGLYRLKRGLGGVARAG
jgi:four helix bundle protein